eukprot:scaffold5880_cov32-Tisochrysis_lutea.AAC.11
MALCRCKHAPERRELRNEKEWQCIPIAEGIAHLRPNRACSSCLKGSQMQSEVSRDSSDCGTKESTCFKAGSGHAP